MTVIFTHCSRKSISDNPLLPKKERNAFPPFTGGRGQKGYCMKQDRLTLYKLIVLYMLSRVSFPLTKAQVIDFILGKEYTNFLTLQQAIAELTDSGLVSLKPQYNRTYLLLTEEGGQTLDYFANRISDAIKQDADLYLQEHEMELRNEIAIRAAYYKSTSGDYETHLSATEKGTELVSIRLSVPLEEMAVSICDNWQKKNQEIYQYLTDRLF